MRPGKRAVPLLLVLCFPAQAGAQALRSTFPRYEPSLPITATPALDGLRPTPSREFTSGVARDYRWTGLIVGAVGLGVSAGAVSLVLCRESQTDESCAGPTALFGLVGATVGAVVGGLVGSWIPKRPPAEPDG